MTHNQTAAQTDSKWAGGATIGLTEHPVLIKHYCIFAINGKLHIVFPYSYCNIHNIILAIQRSRVLNLTANRAVFSSEALGRFILTFWGSRSDHWGVSIVPCWDKETECQSSLPRKWSRHKATQLPALVRTNMILNLNVEATVAYCINLLFRETSVYFWFSAF